MTEGTTSWLDRLRSMSRSHLATQAAILLPVAVTAGLAAWTMLTAPTSARGQGVNQSLAAQAQGPEQGPELGPEHGPEHGPEPGSEAAPAGQAAPVEPTALSGLKISSQSWRRGGLGSNALVTFTLRNDNAYAVKNIEIACSFSREDGSHLTDRKLLIPDAVVNMKSRKTFARMHIGFVNIDANKAKCTPVAANRV
jgi:hypothetical protein